MRPRKKRCVARFLVRLSLFFSFFRFVSFPFFLLGVGGEGGGVTQIKLGIKN